MAVVDHPMMDMTVRSGTPRIKAARKRAAARPATRRACGLAAVPGAGPGVSGAGEAPAKHCGHLTSRRPPHRGHSLTSTSGVKGVKIVRQAHATVTAGNDGANHLDVASRWRRRPIRAFAFDMT